MARRDLGESVERPRLELRVALYALDRLATNEGLPRRVSRVCEWRCEWPAFEVQNSRDRKRRMRVSSTDARGSVA